MNQQLVNPKEYGLEPSQAEQIESVFLPVIQERENLAELYTNIVSKEITKELGSDAKDLRLKLVKVRTNTDRIHKEAKAFYLAGGRFVDPWKNKTVTVIETMEEKLFEIEDFFPKQEREALAKLKEERIKILSEYCENTDLYQVQFLSEEAFNSLVQGQRLIKEQKEAEAKKAEQDRIERERLEAEERERIRLENIRQKQELEAKEKQIAEERAKADAERAESERKLKEEQEKSRIALEKAEAERARIQAEIKAKADAEEKAKREEQERIEFENKRKQLEEKKAKSAPDKTKLIKFASEIESLVLPDVIGEEANRIVNDTKILIGKVVKYVRDNANSI